MSTLMGRQASGEGERITGDYFTGLGVSPIPGRAITADDEKPESRLKCASLRILAQSRLFNKLLVENTGTSANVTALLTT